jgi:hypothetical protein
MSRDIEIPRKDDGSIDYALLGCTLEVDANTEQLARFASRYRGSTDGAMAALAMFASFTCTAKCERLAGRIDAAMLAEKNAETVWQREIKRENRW